jgi:hypothetical protein
MSRFATELIYRDIDSRYYELHEPLIYYSSKFDHVFEAPSGFIFDLESVPIIKGTSNRGGCIHDLVCRKEFNLSILQCAGLYEEAMACVDEMKYHKAKTEGDRWLQTKRFDRWWRRTVKSNVVKINWGGFYHRFSMFATYEELKGNIA